MPDPKSIHTLNARDHIMLEVMRDHFNLSPHQVYREIQGLRQMTEEALALKGIKYDALKSALVPERQRRDIALVFDTFKIESGSYGHDVMKRLIPLFEKRSNHSILAGDYLDRPGSKEVIFDAFEEAVVLRQNVNFQHPTQFFIIYINNLTDAMFDHFDKGLMGYEAYAGYADMTYASRFKTLLSTMLSNSFLKNGKIILQGHEPDREPEENVNMRGYPFEENGYVCKSISDDLMGVLLTYKIERPVFSGFEADTEFALNAVGTSPMAIDDFSIEVEEGKLHYLKTQKPGSMERAGLMTLSREELAEKIREKVSDSYIYNMSYLPDHDVTKFNVMIEFPKTEVSKLTRLLASLEFRPKEKILRLITLF